MENSRYVRVHEPIRLGVTAGLLLFALSIAQPSSQSARFQPMYMPGVNYGAPLGASANLAIFLPTEELPGMRRNGFIVDAGVGQGGARVGFGRMGILEYLGLDARVVAMRTFSSPKGGSAKSTYAGVEGGITIAYVRVSAGIARRLSGPAGSHATIFTWTAGLHYPIAR